MQLQRIFPLLLLSICAACIQSPAWAVLDPNYKSCEVGFRQKWVGMLNKATGWDSPKRFSDNPVWKGQTIPHWAKAIVGGEICRARDNYGLPTIRYFFFENRDDCEHKEEYARKYYEFWRDRGFTVPVITRIPDKDAAVCGREDY
jgi:hypothetical protein